MCLIASCVVLALGVQTTAAATVRFRESLLPKLSRAVAFKYARVTRGADGAPNVWWEPGAHRTLLLPPKSAGVASMVLRPPDAGSADNGGAHSCCGMWCNERV